MKTESVQLLDKADRALTAACHLVESGDLEFAVGRAYYAMFYAAEALLEEQELCFSKHGAVHGAFGELFAKTGKLDPKLHRWLLDAFDARIVGDYGATAVFTRENTQDSIGRAHEFVNVIREYLENVKPRSG